MKKYKYFIWAVAFTVSVSFLTSCDSFPNPFHRTEQDSTEEGSYDESETYEETDSVDKAKKDSIEKAKADSIARFEASIKTKELQDKLSAQGDSINGLDSRIINLEKKSEDSIDKSSAYTFMIFEFIILSLVIWLLYRKLRKLDNRTQNIKRTLKDISSSESGISEFQMSSLINRSIENLAKQINHKNADQDKRMDELAKRLIKLEGPMDPYSQYRPEQVQVKQEQRNEEPRKTDVFYMPRTITKMQFEDSKKTYIKNESAYFKFTIKKSGKATFVFDPYDDSYIGRAYDDRDNSLLTVCELETKNATPKAFNNIEPGEAELRGNVWVVTKKLKLQYV